MILVKAVRLVCGVCMIPAVAACGDAMGPRLADPSGITAKLDAVSGVFHSPVFASGERLSYSFRAAVTGAGSGGMVPAEALGTTYAWNLGASRYEASDRAGAPAGGVRFLLYALDASFAAPVDPLAEIGHVDLSDVTVGTPTVRLVVASSLGARADYTVSGSYHYPSSTWVATGDISAGADTVAFDGTDSGGFGNSSIDVAFRDASQDLDSRLRYHFTYDGYSQGFTVDFRLRLADDVVLVTGYGSFADCYGISCGGGSLTVTVNGRGFTTVDIDAAGRETYRGHLTPDERLALDAIRRSISVLGAGFGGLVIPGSQFLGAPVIP